MASNQPSPLTVNLSDCNNVQIGTNNEQIHVTNSTQTVRDLQNQLNCLKREFEQKEIQNNICRDEQKQQLEEYRNKTTDDIAELQAQLTIIRKKYHKLESESTEQEYRHNEMKSMLGEMRQRDMKTTELTKRKGQLDQKYSASKTNTEEMIFNTKNLDGLKLVRAIRAMRVANHNSDKAMNM